MVNADLRAHFESELQEHHVTRQRVVNVIAALEAQCLVPSTVQLDSWLDERTLGKPSTFISVNNGIVEIPADLDEPVHLHKHSPEWFSVTTRSYNFAPEAQCPRWLAFLNQIMEGDAERIAIHQEWFGLVLTRHGFRQFFFVAEGEGANGKGT